MQAACRWGAPCPPPATGAAACIRYAWWGALCPPPHAAAAGGSGMKKNAQSKSTKSAEATGPRRLGGSSKSILFDPPPYPKSLVTWVFLPQFRPATLKWRGLFWPLWKPLRLGRNAAAHVGAVLCGGPMVAGRSGLWEAHLVCGPQRRAQSGPLSVSSGTSTYRRHRRTRWGGLFWPFPASSWRLTLLAFWSAMGDPLLSASSGLLWPFLTILAVWGLHRQICVGRLGD